MFVFVKSQSGEGYTKITITERDQGKRVVFLRGTVDKIWGEKIHRAMKVS